MYNVEQSRSRFVSGNYNKNITFLIQINTVYNFNLCKPRRKRLQTLYLVQFLIIK